MGRITPRNIRWTFVTPCVTYTFSLQMELVTIRGRIKEANKVLLETCLHYHILPLTIPICKRVKKSLSSLTLKIEIQLCAVYDKNGTKSKILSDTCSFFNVIICSKNLKKKDIIVRTMHVWFRRTFIFTIVVLA